MDADEMRKLTKIGRQAANCAATKAAIKKQQEIEELKTRAKSSAENRLPDILESIKTTARSGLNRTQVNVGESCDFVQYVTDFLSSALRAKGFKVEEKRTTHVPFGSDPYRWDTYTDVDIEMRW